MLIVPDYTTLAGDVEARALEAFAVAGGMAKDWGGAPQAKGAIPLTFSLYLPDGGELNSTNPFSRAIQAAKWSALYEVYSYLNYSLGK